MALVPDIWAVRPVIASSTGGYASGRDSAPLRVLHVTEAYGGGVEAVIAQYCEHEGVDTHVLARSRDHTRTGSRKASRGGVKEVSSRVDFVRAWLKARRDDVDVVHAHSSLAGLLVRLFPPAPHVAVVYTPHAFAFLGYGRRSMRAVARVVERRLISRTDVGAAVSLHEASEFAALGMDPARVVYVPHHFDVAGRLAGRPERFPRRMVGVGRICPQKDPSLFATIARQARDLPGGAAMEFAWIGDGDPQLRQELEDAGVEVLGWVPRCDAVRYLTTATAVLHTARYEGMPVCLLEAMASGTPVVARRIPSVSELAAPALFDTVDQAIAELGRIVDGDDAWQQASARGVREVTDEFSGTAQGASLECAYRTAIRSAAGRLAAR